MDEPFQAFQKLTVERMADIRRMVSRLQRIRLVAARAEAIYHDMLQHKWALFPESVLLQDFRRRVRILKQQLDRCGYVHHCEVTLRDKDGNILKCRVSKVRRRLC